MSQSNSSASGDNMGGPENTCLYCKKPQSELSKPLKRCAKCQKGHYCSRECQVAHWKTHKVSCTPDNNTPSSQTNFEALPKPMGNFLKNLCSDTYLHSFTEPYAYQQLIDCYRMRLEDDSNFANQQRGLYAGKPPIVDFRHFLDLAESRSGLLPKWWTPEKRNGCEDMALDGTQWAHIGSAVGKAGFINHYQDSVMPMKLRLLAEKIYGKKIDMGP